MTTMTGEFSSNILELGSMLPGKMIFGKLWGSRSHNTHLEDSDYDYQAVYVCQTDKILSMRPPQETFDREKPDIQAHEIMKFCQLLMKGNPGIVEMLFTEKSTYETAEWQDIKKERRRFLSEACVEQYLGYAEGQLQRLTKGAYLHTSGGKPNEKWSYHLVRLLWDAQRIAAGGEPLVWKENGEQEELMKIRRGEWSLQRIEDEARSLIGMIEASLAVHKLPKTGDEEFLNEWLIGIRKCH